MKQKIIEGEKHSTSSVWVVTSQSPKKILLLHHKKLEKWLPPGGHIEKFENPIDAAIREVKEETGININFLRKDIKPIGKHSTLLPLPKFLMEQIIPAYQNQPQHFHIDLEYIVEIEEQALQHDVNEAHGIGWFTKEEALKLPINKNTVKIIRQLL